VTLSEQAGADRVQVSLPHGIAEGLAENGVRRFLSLPYAAPMTPENRFRAPQPVQPWAGVRDATRPGPCAPQIVNPVAELDVAPLMGTPDATGPDYLTLNVFAPDQPEGPTPVMVFIHGGSFVAGSKDASAYNGSAFARDGVVCVTINYRLGIEGFLPIPGVPTNLGLRDMIAALQWVQAHIARFGGDPANVTLFGESGGAYSTADLMTSPLAAGLFQHAICQSGHSFGTRSLAVMQRLVTRLARRLRITPDRAGFLSVPADKLLAAQQKVMLPSPWWDMRDAGGWDPSFGVSRFLPVHGDDVLPEPPTEAMKRGAGREVDLLIGSNSEEANLFFIPGGTGAKLNAWAARYFMSRAIPRAGEALRAYGLGQKGEAPGKVLARAMTDLMFRQMTRRMAELHQGRSYVYEFEWRSPAVGGELGAAHALELPFVFDTLASATSEHGLLGPAPPQGLADHVHALWVRFATDGAAPWPAFDAGTRLVYSLTRQAVQHEPALRERIARCVAYLKSCCAMMPSSFQTSADISRRMIAPSKINSGTMVVCWQKARFNLPCSNLSSDVETVAVMLVRSFASCCANSSFQ
jgi:para-nitrobenzyl esterase